jgi:hypothetical protein
MHNHDLALFSSRSSIRDREHPSEAVRFAKTAHLPDYAKIMQKDYAKFMQDDYAKSMQQDYAKFIQEDYAKSKYLK